MVSVRRNADCNRVLAPAIMETRARPAVGQAVGLLAAFSIVAVLGSALPAHAESSWHCGTRLVGTGLTLDDVYARCGAPIDRTFSVEYVTVRVAYDVAVTRPVAVEQWLYNPGPNQFLRYLTFRDGTLVAIDEGSYGY